ncbi:hypothetical protein M5689_013950 [Euphorbia peplus]|nr:hypothetical protein M5689_013950 [Euphorbia peplus]
MSLKERARAPRISPELEVLDEVHVSCNGRTVLSADLKYAEIALKSYEERQEAKFVILQVLFSNRAKLDAPGYDADKLWCHVSFIAEPRNVGCIHDPPKHFFGEMVFDRAQDKYDVTYCSIFDLTDPSNAHFLLHLTNCGSWLQLSSPQMIDVF